MSTKVGFSRYDCSAWVNADINFVIVNECPQPLSEGHTVGFTKAVGRTEQQLPRFSIRRMFEAVGGTERPLIRYMC